MSKVVIYVKGGLVQSVFTDIIETDFDLIVYDADNLEAEGKDKAEIDEELQLITDGLIGVY